MTRTRMLLLGAMACVAAAAGVWLGFGRSSHRVLVMSLLAPPITMDRPLSGGEQTTLAGASAKLGATITLPSAEVSELSAANVGSVWVRQDGGRPADEGHSTSVAVTFPSLGVILQFTRPVGYPQPPAQMYQTEASQRPDAMSAIDLDGVPALYTVQNSDQFKQNYGAIQFVSHGTYMAVLGHYELDTLRGYATALLSSAAG